MLGPSQQAYQSSASINKTFLSYNTFGVSLSEYDSLLNLLGVSLRKYFLKLFSLLQVRVKELICGLLLFGCILMNKNGSHAELIKSLKLVTATFSMLSYVSFIDS